MADTGDAKEWRDRYYVSIYFSLYRDYRIVRMADAQGNVREGIFIPFIQNGIEYDPNGRATPKQVLHVNKKSYGRGKRLTPTITAEMRERMIQAGVISPSDKKAVGHVGLIVSDYGYERIFDDEKKG